jgi:hypothetical protein
MPHFFSLQLLAQHDKAVADAERAADEEYDYFEDLETGVRTDKTGKGAASSAAGDTDEPAEDAVWQCWE